MRWRGKKRLSAHLGDLVRTRIMGPIGFEGPLTHGQARTSWGEKGRAGTNRGCQSSLEGGPTPPWGASVGHLLPWHRLPSQECGEWLWMVCLPQFHSLKYLHVLHSRCLNYLGVGVRNWEIENVWFLFRPWRCQKLGDGAGSDPLTGFGVVRLGWKREKTHGGLVKWGTS